MKNKGVSLVELLIVIVVLGILAGFGTASVVKIVTKQRIGVDSYNLRYLNESTIDFVEDSGVALSDIFTGYDTDDERMTLLADNGYFFKTPQTAQSGATFEWNESTYVWELIGGEFTTVGGFGSATIDFSTDSIADIEADGTVSINMDKWDTDDGYLENTTGETRLFIPINKATYTIEVSAQLTSGNSGGYGVFFHTTLDDGNVNRDNGFVLQFDRGYGSGAFIVRPRVNGRERGPVWTERASSIDGIPTKTEDAAWWTSTHTVKIVVTNIDSDTCNAQFYIDGVSLGNLEFDNDTEGEQIYTGFRGWGSSSTKFHSISID